MEAHAHAVRVADRLPERVDAGGDQPVPALVQVAVPLAPVVGRLDLVQGAPDPAGIVHQVARAQLPVDPIEVAVPVRFELLPDRVDRAGAQHVADVGVALQPLVGSVDAVGAHQRRLLLGERHQLEVGDPRRSMVAELRMGAGARAQPVLGEGDFLIGQIGYLPEDLLQAAALEVSAGLPFEDGEGLIAGEPGPQPYHVAGGVVPVDLTDVAGVDADRDGVRAAEVQPAGDVGRSGLRVGHEHGAAERGRLVG